MWVKTAGIIGYVNGREFYDAAIRKDFTYLPESDCFKVYEKTSSEFLSIGI